MTTVGDIIRFMNRIAPFERAEKWDNSGLLAGDENQPVKKVMLALDAADWVIAEAAEKKADLLITHHPAFFDAFKRVTAPGKAYRLVRNGIALISAHTNLDIAAGGVNDALAELFQLTDISGLERIGSRPYYKVCTFVPDENAQAVYQAMADAGAGALGDYTGCGYFTKGEGTFVPGNTAHPFIGNPGQAETVKETKIEMLCAPDLLGEVIDALKEAHPYEEPAYDIFENHGVKQELFLGKVGFLQEPCSVKDFALLIKKALKLDTVCMVDGGRKIQKVAICSGAGSSSLPGVIASKADAFLTGELKYSAMLELKERGITAAVAGHFETENVVLPALKKQLVQAFPEVEVVYSETNRSPMEFY